MKEKHWTVLQAEAAERTPEWARPFCWHCRRTMVWAGCWMCPDRARADLSASIARERHDADSL